MFGFAKKTEPEPFVSAIIVAAGTASRMGGLNKQTAVIDEIPVVVRSIAAFNACPRICEIIVVCREEHIADFFDLVREYQLDKVSSVVTGGQTRQDSVFGGVEACSSETAYIAVHDGARPLVTQQIIEACLDAAVMYGAAAAGVRSKDTVKLADARGVILSTPDREKTYNIQTPQAFSAVLYRRAMALALREQRVYTDDCQLVERAGEQVYISQGSYENIKITTPEDLAVANAILTYREGGLEACQIVE